jgi:hypothetical protein
VSQIPLILLAVVITVLCGLSKPNYLLALLPVMALWLLWRWFRKQPLYWEVAILGVMLPALLFLGWQYYFTYVNPSALLEGSSLAFAPFDAVLTISGSRAAMILRFLGSVAFPVVVYLSYWRRATHDGILNFAWLTFMAGAAFMYLFTETGPRATHGNFFWGAYITLFLLNFASAHFALRQWIANRGKMNWQTGLCVLVFALHVWSGFHYLQRTTDWLFTSLP